MQRWGDVLSRSVLEEQAVDMASASSSAPREEHQLMWSEIELGERYLVSNMLEDAATTSTASLRKLLGHDALSDGRMLRFPDHGILVQNACMVLMQAYSGSGRTEQLFQVLEEFFEPFVTVPQPVFLVAACLQIAGGFTVTCRVALERFLREWSQNPDDFTNMVAASASNVFLPAERYAHLAEIYAIHVLVYGFRASDVALSWLRGSPLPEDTKRLIIKKVYTITQPQRAGNLMSVSQPQARVQSPETSSSDSETQVQAVEENLAAGDDQYGVRGGNKVVVRKGGALPGTQGLTLARIIGNVRAWWVFRLLKRVVQVICARLRMLYLDAQRGLGRRAAVGGFAVGGFAIFLLYAFLRQGRVLSKIFRDYLRKMNTGICDVWQLAFSVQLNPLAAVDPLPARRVYGSRYA